MGLEDWFGNACGARGMFIGSVSIVVIPSRERNSLHHSQRLPGGLRIGLCVRELRIVCVEQIIHTGDIEDVQRLCLQDGCDWGGDAAPGRPAWCN